MSRGRMGCLWMILKPVVLLGVILVLIGVVAYPWAVPLPGRDALTGPWVGDVRSSEGPAARLFINLRIARGYRLNLIRGNRLGGEAVLCTARRRIELSVIGYATSWSGKSVDLLLKPVRPGPPELRFDVLGTWDGHTLELKDSRRSLAEALNQPVSPASESRQSPHWIAVSLRRGARVAFDSACAA